MTISKTSLANRAADLVGIETFLDVETATTADSKLVKRNYEPVLLRCLRRSDWPFAIKRLSLNPDIIAPTNEFTYQYTLPSDFVRLTTAFPRWLDHRIENGKLLCNENQLTVRYVSNAVLLNPQVMDASFEEYFVHELAVALTYKKTDSVQLRNELRQTAEAIFKEATALHSQEGTDEPKPLSPWLTSRGDETDGWSPYVDGGWY